MFDQLKNMFKMIMGDDELFDLNAKLYFKLKQSFVKAGFTDEEAIKLLCSQKMLGTSQSKSNETGE